jgi:hypothetical protein
VFLLLSCMAPRAVSSLRLCKPFSQINHADMIFTFVEIEKTPADSLLLTFFVEKQGTKAEQDHYYAIASMSAIYQDVMKLPLMVGTSSLKTPVKCSISAAGFEDFRYVARATCQLAGLLASVEDEVTFHLDGADMPLQLCNDNRSTSSKVSPSSSLRPSTERRSTKHRGGAAAPTLAVCVRSFSATVFGTDEIAVLPHHVVDWLDHHIALGIDKFYLYERNKDELNTYLESYMAQNPEARELVEITYVPLLSKSTKTFDALETKSYIYDQMLVMHSCFAKARSEGFDFVFHIDYDEYIHTRSTDPTTSLHEIFQNELLHCPPLNSLTLERCNIPGVTADVPTTPPDAFCGRNPNNCKTAFNASQMAEPDTQHTVHVMCPGRCDAESLFIHHLPDAYADRSQSATYRRFLGDDSRMLQYPTPKASKKSKKSKKSKALSSKSKLSKSLSSKSRKTRKATRALKLID